MSGGLKYGVSSSSIITFSAAFGAVQAAVLGKMRVSEKASPRTIKTALISAVSLYFVLFFLPC